MLVSAVQRWISCCWCCSVAQSGLTLRPHGLQHVRHHLPGATIFVFWRLSFKPAFPLSSFTFKRLFSSSSLSAIRVVLSAHLRLLIFLPSILIPTCASSSLAFCLMYYACKLNEQDDNIHLWHTPFPICNQSVVPCLVLNVASWPTYRFHRKQVRLVFPSLEEFSTFVIYTVKGFGIVNKAEVDVFLEFPCFFYDPTDATLCKIKSFLNLIFISKRG